MAAEGVRPDGSEDSLAATLRFADGSVGTILYSAVGDPAVAKERVEVFANGIVIEIDDFSRLSVSRGGKTTRRKAAQDKGQANLVRAFLAATRGEAPPPVPLDELEAVSAFTLELAGQRR